MSKNFSIKTFNANGLFLHPLKTFVFHILGGTKRVNNLWSEKPFESWMWVKLQPFLSLFEENCFDCVKVFVSGKLPWSRQNFCLLKNLLFVENFRDCGKFPWLWKSSLTVEKFLDCEKVLWLWKSSLIKENLVSWLQKN